MSSLGLCECSSTFCPTLRSPFLPPPLTQQDGENRIVKGGSLVKLVERLTHHTWTDPQYQFQFLFTFRSALQSLSILLTHCRIGVHRLQSLPSPLKGARSHHRLPWNSTFCTPEELLDLLILRYNIPTPADVVRSKLFNKVYVLPVRLR